MAAAVTADPQERLLRWLSIILTVVAMLAVAGLLLLQDESRFRFELTLTSVGFLGIIILSPTVGALIIQRRPFTRVAWLLVFIGVSLGLGLLTAARTPVRELEQHLGIQLLKEDEEADIDTLGGLVFALVGRVPARGELIRHPAGVEFEVLDADPRRVKKLRVHVTRRPASAEASIAKS